uniref:ATP-dependent RNA helicase n=1 Tax=Calcidiscus leptoporus TaxID=127549 RepID=A0A7S0ITF9_9EUKA
MGVTEPNAMQVQAVPALSGGADLLLGAQTGSGKTLTYLVPIMQRLKADEEAIGARALPRRPRALVLLPTRELALQVQEVGRCIGKRARLSVAVVHGGVPEGPQKRQFEYPVDLLVATPGRLLQLLSKGGVYLGDVRQVVIDEVDTMFEAGFGDELDRILRITTRDLSADPRAAAASKAPGGGLLRVQHVAVGATHPKSALVLYERRLAGAKRLMIEGVHSVPPTLQQRFISCKGPDGKVAELKLLLGDADEKGFPPLGRVVLFCNSQASARFVDHTLAEAGFSTANYHGAVPANTRADNFARFRSGEAAVLVTTDIAARGLDRLLVDHVVQFDFAKNAPDYLHRCGRTARAGKRGTVYSLVTKHDVELVRAIQQATAAGEDVLDAAERAAPRPSLELRPRKGPKAAFPDCNGLPSKVARGAAAVGSGSGRRAAPGGALEGARHLRGSGGGRRGGRRGEGTN